jgi:predicted transcriptional regulator
MALHARGGARKGRAPGKRNARNPGVVKATAVKATANGGGPVRGFGDLEAVIMDQVWAHETPVTVRDLFEKLREDRSIAYTTVMSTMDNLHRKGWLARERDGKAYRYTAVSSREEYSARLMREAMAGAGDTEAVLSHFVAQMDGTESAALRAVLDKLAGRPS